MHCFRIFAQPSRSGCVMLRKQCKLEIFKVYVSKGTPSRLKIKPWAGSHVSLLRREVHLIVQNTIMIDYTLCSARKRFRMQPEPKPPCQSLWPNNRYMARRRCLKEHQWDREGTFRDCRPTLKPLVQNFHPVRSSWSKNRRISAHIFSSRVLLLIGLSR